MMTECRDQMLENLFNEADRELEGEAITTEVMTHTRKRLFTKVAGGVSAVIIVLLASWYVFAGPLLEFVLLVSSFLTNPIVELGEGWLALVFMPVNNIASLCVLTTKVALMAWKKLTGTALIR